MKKTGIIIGIVAVVIIGIIVAVVAMSGKTNSEVVEQKITICVFDKEANRIYNQEVETKQEHLDDVLKEVEELKVVTESSEYGAYITSIMDIEQGDNFYWSYYIDGEYAQVGISSCKIEDGKTYDFKIEKFEQ